MRVQDREAQILRVKSTSIQPELDRALKASLRTAVVRAVKTTLETALEAELSEDLASMTTDKPRRSGHYSRGLDTQYGHVDDLQVPKLRRRNQEREWQILGRYQRQLGNLLDWLCCLYVMGLSLRDLQEALYFLIGHVISRSAVNQVTLKVQQQLDSHRQRPIAQTPEILIVDGVWVDIQYTLDAYKVDRSGHQRQRRQAEERVIIAALAVWADGTHEMLHYAVAKGEGEAEWNAFFEQLITRGLIPKAIKLVVSDGTLGLPKALKQQLPNAQQQRCITHKVRGLDRYLAFAKLPTLNAEGEVLSVEEGKRRRRYEIKAQAYEIYKAESVDIAQQRLETFVATWQSLEPKAVKAFQRHLDLTFTFYKFEDALHSHIRTTNHIERLFREFRTKSDEIGAFPNETSCLTVFFLVVQRDHAKHDRKNMAKDS